MDGRATDSDARDVQPRRTDAWSSCQGVKLALRIRSFRLDLQSQFDCIDSRRGYIQPESRHVLCRVVVLLEMCPLLARYELEYVCRIRSCNMT